MFSGIATLRKICNHPDLVGIKEKFQVRIVVEACKVSMLPINS